MPRPERSVDPEDGPVARFAVELRKLRRNAGSPGYRELSRRAHYSPTTLAQAARGMSLPSLPVTLAYVRACGGDASAWEERWHAVAAALDPEPPPDDTPGGRAPYVGLAAYGVDDAEWFCGRDRLVATLTERVARQRFVAVVGASGAGKSSLLRAGLVAAMSANGNQCSVITPGAHPLEECAGHQLMAQDSTEFLLVVDQFEEVFTLCRDAGERDRFIAGLLDAADDPDSRVRVVVGLRADFYAHCARHPRLVEALQDAQVLVGPMSTDELTEAVTQPAKRAGLMVDRTLITTIVHDADGRPGVLPFVSHALWETWRRRRGNGLFPAGYLAAGGVCGAITQTADRLYRDLDERQRHAAKRILLRLTALGEGTEDTRRRVTLTELDADPATAEVLGRLAAARLITVGEDTVEIAHEALIRGWPTLREWLAADRERLRAHRRLTEAAAEWARHGRDEGHLYRGSVLATWQNHDQDTLNELEHEFLHASVSRENRDRAVRQRRTHAALVGAAVIVLLVGLLAMLAVFQADQARGERDLALSRQLAANARAQLRLDPELALLLAIEAVRIEPTAEADAALRQALVDSRALATFPISGGEGPANVAISPDGRRVAVTDAGYRLRVVEQPAPGGPWKTRMVLPGYHHVAFSQDGRYLASANGSAVHVLDLDRGGDPVVLRGGRTDTVMDVRFSPDGRLLAAAVDGGVRLWDLTGRRAPVLLEIKDEGPPFGFAGADTIAFSSDGRYLTSIGRTDGSVWIWDLTGQQQVVVFHPPERQLAFSPDGNGAALGCADGSARIVDPRGVRAPVVLRADEGLSMSATFSPDGRQLACGGMDGTIQVIDIGGDVEPLLLLGHHSDVRDMAFSRDGHRLASVGSDDVLRLWSTAAPGDPVEFHGHDGPVSTAMFTPDGKRVVSGGMDATVRVWHTEGGEPVVLGQHGDAILDVDVSRDGRWIASISRDGVVLVQDAATGEVRRELSTPDGDFVAFSPDGRRLVTNGDSGTFRVWDLSSGNFTTHGTGYLDGYRQVEFSPDGKRIAAAAGDGTVQLWPARGFGAPTVRKGHQGGVDSVAFSPDGRRVASGGHDGTVRIWPTIGFGQPFILRGHQGDVTSVAFSPNGGTSPPRDETAPCASGTPPATTNRSCTATTAPVSYRPPSARTATICSPPTTTALSKSDSARSVTPPSGCSHWPTPAPPATSPRTSEEPSA